MGKVVERGPTVARYLEKDVPEWYTDERGRRYTYVGIAPQSPPGSGRVDLDEVDPGHSVLAPGLLYRPEATEEDVQTGHETPASIPVAIPERSAWTVLVRFGRTHRRVSGRDHFSYFFDLGFMQIGVTRVDLAQTFDDASAVVGWWNERGGKP